MPAERRLRWALALAATQAAAHALGAEPRLAAAGSAPPAAKPPAASAPAPAAVPPADAELLEYIAEFSEADDGFVDPLSLDDRVNRDAARALDQQIKRRERAKAKDAVPPAQEE